MPQDANHAPPSPPPLLADTIALARSLQDALSRESAAVAAMDVRHLAGFTAVKKVLIAAYLVKLEEIRESAAALAGEPALTELRTLNASVMTLARRNGALLRGAIDATRSIIDVAMAARFPPRTPPAITYRADGRWHARPCGSA